MKKFALLIFITGFCASFAPAQKTVRQRPKTIAVQISAGRPVTEDNRSSNSINSNETNQTFVNSRPTDKPLKILDKPRPNIFPDGQDCSQGKVVLRVTFLSSGEIGTISVISGLTKSKTAGAIEAAKQMKFEPATKAGKPVTVTKPVEYVFSIY